MQIPTTRFGPIEIESDDVLLFPEGLIGMPACRQFVLLADAENSVLAWLQSTERADVAMAVVSPRRFIPSYQLRLARRELAPLALADVSEAQVLVIVGRNDRGITVNLRGPLVLNLERGVGRQVIANGDAPLDFELAPLSNPLKKSA